MVAALKGAVRKRLFYEFVEDRLPAFALVDIPVRAGSAGLCFRFSPIPLDRRDQPDGAEKASGHFAVQPE